MRTQSLITACGFYFRDLSGTEVEPLQKRILCFSHEVVRFPVFRLGVLSTFVYQGKHHNQATVDNIKVILNSANNMYFYALRRWSFVNLMRGERRGVWRGGRVPGCSPVPPWYSTVLKLCLIFSVVWFPHRCCLFVGYHLKINCDSWQSAVKLQEIWVILPLHGEQLGWRVTSEKFQL